MSVKPIVSPERRLINAKRRSRKLLKKIFEKAETSPNFETVEWLKNPNHWCGSFIHIKSKLYSVASQDEDDLDDFEIGVSNYDGLIQILYTPSGFSAENVDMKLFKQVTRCDEVLT